MQVGYHGCAEPSKLLASRLTPSVAICSARRPGVPAPMSRAASFSSSGDVPEHERRLTLALKRGATTWAIMSTNLAEEAVNAG